MAKLDLSKNLLLSLIAICIILIHLSAFAEYRTYELEIQNPETGQARSVTSTYDNYQYPQIYPVNPGEIVVYKTSWMCWENTSLREPCKPQTNE